MPKRAHIAFFWALAGSLLQAVTSADANDVPYARFTDITKESGIAFLQNNGASGDKLLPETMGGGVAFFDFDNDGQQDLLFINSTWWPGHVPAGKSPTTMALYRNLGKGRFADVTPGSGLDVAFYGMGVAIGDYDNDGLPDVFATGVGGNRLFHNEGNGKFREVTQTADVAGTNDGWSTSAAWIDYDNDGKLDLFVCNYVRWSPEIDRAANFELPKIGRAYGPPRKFQGTFPYLYHNEGNGKEIGARSGVAYDAYGLTRGAMGIDSARFRNDDTLGIAIGNFANEMNALYVAQRDSLLFADEATREGVGPASQKLLKFGLFFFDYDLDGRLDVLTANGHLEPEINQVDPSQKYRQPAQLFWNRGDKTGMGFQLVPPEKCGSDILKPIIGRGSAFADIDGDGDLDVVLTQVGGPPLLLRNDQKLGHHWLRLKLVGSRSNRDAIGAWIKVRAGGRTLSRQVMPTRSYLSQSELPVTIGLGQATKVEAVEIIWPSGAKQKIAPPVDRLSVVTEP